MRAVGGDLRRGMGVVGWVWWGGKSEVGEGILFWGGRGVGGGKGALTGTRARSARAQ